MQFDYGAAIKAGYTPEEIQQELQRTGATPVNMPQTTPTQTAAPATTNLGFTGNKQLFAQSGPYTQKEQLATGTDRVKNFLLDALPTAGAIGGGIIGSVADPVVGPLGSVAGAGIGAGVGETAREYLGGQKLDPGKIAIESGSGAIGEGIGKGLTYVGGKILSGAGDALAGRSAQLKNLVTPKMFDSVIPDDLNYASNLQSLTKTATQYGLTDGDPLSLLPKVKQTAQAINKQIQSLPEMNNPFNTQSAIQDFQKELINNGVDPSSPQYKSLIESAQNKILGMNGTQDTPILGANGLPIASNKAPTIADAYNLKSQTANNELQRVFTKLKSPTGTDLTPEQRVQLSLFNSLKNSIDAQGTPVIRQLNNDQHNLFDIGRAYAKAAPKTNGMSRFSISDIFPIGGAEFLSTLAGMHPGMGAAVATGVDMASKNPRFTDAGAKLFSTMGNSMLHGGAGKIMPALGAGTAAGIANANTPDSTLNSTTPTGGSSLTDLQSNLPKEVTVSPNGDVILPPLQSHTVPQLYPYENYISDMQKASNDLASQERLTKIYQASQEQAKNQIAAMGLNNDEQQTLRDAPNAMFLMNRVQKQLAAVPPSLFNRFKTWDQLQKYNNGQYAALATDLQTLQAEVGKQNQGGALRGYDITNLQTGPTLGDSPEAANAKINQLRILLANSYMNKYKQYGLTTSP